MSDNIPEELLTNYRAKREAPCHGPGGGHKKEFPSQRCCKEAIENPESLDKIKEMKKECFSRIKENRTEIETEMDAFSCDRLQKKKAEIRCAYECILKKQLMVSGSNLSRPPIQLIINNLTPSSSQKMAKSMRRQLWNISARNWWTRHG